MLRIVLIRPGSTDFDQQGRIKGTLDIPLNAAGTAQAERLATELASHPIQALYTAPCQCSSETAAILAKTLGVSPKPISKLSNLDHGLWHGKLIEEVRQKQPRVYKQVQEHPESICPPDGEALAAARARVRQEVKKLLKRHTSGEIAIVLPEPLTTMVRCLLQNADLGDIWKVECECGNWVMIDVDAVPALIES